MKRRKLYALGLAALLALTPITAAGCSSDNETIVIRVANWEEYIDEGDWDEDEAIDIENEYSGDYIIGENSVIDDFTEWFNSQNYGFNVEVEYSTFGTNEDLYNQLKLGSTYDLVCPSDYMIIKLLDEDRLQSFSDEFLDPDIETNYYIRGVSSYIDGTEDSIFYQNGWYGIAACYMWGTTGIVYNYDEIEDESDVTAWNILINSDYYKSITVKDNVRDAYFAALSILYEDDLNAINSNETMSQEEKALTRSALLNDTDEQTIAEAKTILKQIKENVYSFETDSGKTDMVTGKVVANFQWSGDAVYIMDQAEEDETNLWYSVPDESTNLWFDGWVMLKDAINGDEKRQFAAESFVNFLSRPDIAIRNMYYIGYSSSIAEQTVFDYFDWCYGAVTDPEDDEYYEIEALYEYDVSYFFGDKIDEDECTIYLDMDTVDVIGYYDTGETEDGLTIYSGGTISRGRQAFSQYPTEDVIERSVIMLDFGDDLSAINQMWIEVRCFDLFEIKISTVIIITAIIVVIVAAICLYVFRYRIFYNKKRR